LERIATVQASEARVDVVRIAAESGELRQLVLSMNHWLASLRQNLGALEHTESDERRRADTLYADIVERILQSDAQRPARLSVFVETLARALQPSAQVLDLESGGDWLALLTGRGYNVVGVDANQACAERGRAAGLSINAAVPSAVLSRTADESLDGLTALACTALLRDLPVPALLTQAQRVLRPGGALMFAFGVSASSIADRLCGRSEHRLDESLLSHALAASGFSDLETIVTADGAACVIARKPHTASAQ
jgi:SAM-dependent methyltransferase